MALVDAFLLRLMAVYQAIASNHFGCASCPAQMAKRRERNGCFLQIKFEDQREFDDISFHVNTLLHDNEMSADVRPPWDGTRRQRKVTSTPFALTCTLPGVVMKNTAPHYLLITETETIIDSREDDQATSRRSGHWRFVLEQMGVEARIEVADEEPNVTGERLELLAVVRGLESLEQSSRVTLLTSSRYVGRGIRQGMNQWRSNQWKWERFGKMTLINNHDLWRRVDHSLQFHSLECRIWDLNRLAPHATAASASPSFRSSGASTSARVNHRRLRSNVIRPHGDHTATNRKPIEPLGFLARTKPTDQDIASETPQNIVRIRDTGSGTSKKLKSTEPPPSISETSTPGTSDQCENHQRKDRAHTINSMARVKPPRAGRAYGYAVN